MRNKKAELAWKNVIVFLTWVVFFCIALYVTWRVIDWLVG